MKNNPQSPGTFYGNDKHSNVSNINLLTLSSIYSVTWDGYHFRGTHKHREENPKIK